VPNEKIVLGLPFTAHMVERRRIPVWLRISNAAIDKLILIMTDGRERQDQPGGLRHVTIRDSDQSEGQRTGAAGRYISDLVRK
jgi:hypothetical protein